MNAANWGRLGFVLLGALFFQVCVLDEVVVFGAHPDVMVLVAAAAGIVAGPARGAVVGFVAGLVADLTVVTPYGLGALCLVLVGFGVGLARPHASEQGLAAADVLACVAAAASGTLCFALLGALIGQPGMFEAAPAAIFVVAIGACVLAYPVLLAVRWAMTGTSHRASLAIPRGGSAAG